MGHCAPTVMQTLLDASETEAPWLVRLVAGLPGGIGNTRAECGGITAPLVVLGLRHARDPLRDGLPVVIYKGHELLRRFAACRGTFLCRKILGDARLPLRCIGVIRRAPEQCVETLDDDGTAAIPKATQEAYCRLYAHCSDAGFHCAHEVFRHMGNTGAVNADLRDGTSAFLGGTVLTGMTCSAFTAGVMALGLALGPTENSRLRVLRMIGTMAVGGDASANHLNAFNPVMNLGYSLSQWFTAEFGSTQCRALTQCDFATRDGVERYISGGGVARCSAVAEKTALKVQSLMGRPLT